MIKRGCIDELLAVDVDVVRTGIVSVCVVIVVVIVVVGGGDTGGGGGDREARFDPVYRHLRKINIENHTSILGELPSSVSSMRYLAQVCLKPHRI